MLDSKSIACSFPKIVVDNFSENSKTENVKGKPEAKNRTKTTENHTTMNTESADTAGVTETEYAECMAEMAAPAPAPAKPEVKLWCVQYYDSDICEWELDDNYQPTSSKFDAESDARHAKRRYSGTKVRVARYN